MASRKSGSASKRQAMVREFHRLALVHGGSDAGPPVIRDQYDARHHGNPPVSAIRTASCLNSSVRLIISSASCYEFQMLR
jgi:hypothetical protein